MEQHGGRFAENTTWRTHTMGQQHPGWWGQIWRHLLLAGIRFLCLQGAAQPFLYDLPLQLNAGYLILCVP